VLKTYSLPYDSKVPVVVMDEQPVQLFNEVRKPIAATKHHAKRVDFEYERAGVVNIFLFSEPLGCWRRVSVRERKTAIDWAHEVRRLLEEDYPHAEKIRLVCDNLNTHSYGALYEAFAPEVAFSLGQRLEFVYTPKHGSWLNIAENELSVLTVQCVRGRRFGTKELLSRAVESWSLERNSKQKGVDWQFSIGDARIKLKTLYPKIIEE